MSFTKEEVKSLLHKYSSIGLNRKLPEKLKNNYEFFKVAVKQNYSILNSASA